jgi:hypothetical protein
MEATALGLWLLEQWLNKQVDFGDYDFAVLMDVVAEIKQDGFLTVMAPCMDELIDAKRYGLITGVVKD